MSQLAEYAQHLQESEPRIDSRKIVPVDYASGVEKLGDIRAIIFDVYGTLLNYWKPGFNNKEKRVEMLMQSFSEIAETFGMSEILRQMNPADPPEKTLSEFYNGLIALNHEKAAQKGILFPEIKIEEIWGVIIMMLKRNGYTPEKFSPGPVEELSRYIAYAYNFISLGRTLYPGVVDALEQMKKSNIVLGIVSNAQFYTPIDLTLLIREQSAGKYDDYIELFDPDAIFYSYEYGVAKPNQLLFRKLYDALYEMQILPEQTVFVGNDLLLDIKPAAEAGMKTAFFTGDSESAFMHDLSGEVIPDIVFSQWSDLPSRISFYNVKEQQ